MIKRIVSWGLHLKEALAGKTEDFTKINDEKQFKLQSTSRMHVWGEEHHSRDTRCFGVNRSSLF